MTKLIFVRHGESDGNKLRRFIGQGDLPLTERGRKQADLAAEYLKDEPIDAFYASDLSRAFETAEHIAAVHKKPVQPAEELREIFAGSWEGTLFDDLEKNEREAYGVWLRTIGLARCRDGESVEELYKRVNGFVDRIVKENPGKTLLCATHATPIRVLMCRWYGLPLSRMHEIPWVKNASVTVVDYDENGKTMILKEGEAAFMGDLQTELPDNV